jgi:hypothetical protein
MRFDLLSLPKIVRIASIIILAASLTACDGAEVRDDLIRGVTSLLHE